MFDSILRYSDTPFLPSTHQFRIGLVTDKHYSSSHFSSLFSSSSFFSLVFPASVLWREAAEAAAIRAVCD
ncbi:hypothetical protein CAEBREN_10015 [Caenorhabditis brenneri]|uniref:Uncharacterized protein n=1 Tax=Caenorhabditis brenneri TaxID=135651 RepID=G0P9U4_CAEBE|nr:hypothetical protein CAEBREN_10015 [Caenorhabditis brenneri]